MHTGMTLREDLLRLCSLEEVPIRNHDNGKRSGPLARD
jgi:hypothetical protein